MSKLPVKIKNINDEMRQYNGYIAQWMKREYKGKVPLNIIEALFNINGEIEIFLSDYKELLEHDEEPIAG